MQEDYTVFKLPAFARAEAKVSDANTPSSETLKIYQELNQIAEELESCRLKNSL